MPANNSTRGHFILVKHAMPEITPQVPASLWNLSDSGRQAASLLADKAVAHLPQIVFSSLEPKAMETGLIISRKLGLPFEARRGLHEHVRPKSGFFSDQKTFEKQVSLLFNRPQELVFGDETAQQAQKRFTDSLRDVLKEAGERTPVIVAHGTVITLFICQFNQVDPFQFWLNLGLPSYVVLSRADFQLLEVFGTIE